MERVKDFPWPARVSELDELIAATEIRILFWWMLSICPDPLTFAIVTGPETRRSRRAVLLFTAHFRDPRRGSFSRKYRR